MSSIVHAATELTTSIVGVFISLFNAIFAIFHGAFALAGEVLGSTFKVGTHAISMVTNLFQGVVAFIAANFVAIAIIGGIYYTYTLYQERQKTGVLRNGKTRG